MDESRLLNAIRDCADRTEHQLLFQLIQDSPALHLFVNRTPEAELDYSTLSRHLQSTIATECQTAFAELPPEQWPFQVLYLYSRIVGNVDPDWTDVVGLIPATDTPSIEATIPTEDPTVKDDVELVADDIPVAIIEATIPTEDSTVKDDVELVADDIPVAIDDVGSLPATNEPPDNSPTDADASNSLDSYCFTRNINDRRSILAVLEGYYKRGELDRDAVGDSIIGEWLDRLDALNEEEKRRSSIWLSRYCYDPEATIAELTLAKKPPLVTDDEPEEVIPPPSNTLENRQANSRHYTPPSPNNSAEEANLRQKKKPIGKKILYGMVAWAIATIIVIIGVAKTTVSAVDTDRVCKDSKFAQECNLAVEIVGKTLFEKYLKEATPLPTEFSKEDASETVYQFARIFSGQSFNAPNLSPLERGISSRIEEVLPGIFLGDAVAKNYRADKQSDTIRIAGVMLYRPNVADRKKMFDTIDYDGIPLDWPKTPYSKENHVDKMLRASAIKNHFIVQLLTEPIFTLIAMGIVGILGLGLRFHTIDALFQASLLFGVMESILAPILSFSIWIVIPLEIGILFVVSQVVKDFEMDLNAGKAALFGGTTMLLTSRGILNLMFAYILFCLA
jgi:hypothetical protein